MLIVKTLHEAKEATTNSTCLSFTFQKKKSHIELHEGHSKILEKNKTSGNKIIVSFWYTQAVLNYINKMWPPEPTLEWDLTGCLTWAKAQNVDIIWIPDYENELAIYNVDNLEHYKNVINIIWEKENYKKHFGNDISSEKTKILCLGRLIANTGWKYLYSWKDGITRYIERDFMHKYTNSRVIIDEPIKTPDGLYYSSSYFKYTEMEKTELLKIEQAVLSSNLTSKDPVGILADNIRTSINNPSFALQNVNISSDERFLGPNKKIIDIKFSIGSGEDIKYDHYAFLI